jgi:hypothetical protein
MRIAFRFAGWNHHFRRLTALIAEDDAKSFAEFQPFVLHGALLENRHTANRMPSAHAFGEVALQL